MEATNADQRCLFLQMKGVRFADEIKQHNQPCPCEIIKRTAVTPSPQIWGVSQLPIDSNKKTKAGIYEARRTSFIVYNNCS